MRLAVGRGLLTVENGGTAGPPVSFAAPGSRDPRIDPNAMVAVVRRVPDAGELRAEPGRPARYDARMSLSDVHGMVPCSPCDHLAQITASGRQTAASGIRTACA